MNKSGKWQALRSTLVSPFYILPLIYICWLVLNATMMRAYYEKYTLLTDV